MLLSVAKGLIAVCTLKSFLNMPPRVEGQVILMTERYIVMKIENQIRTQFIEITVEKKECKLKEK